MTWLCLLKVKLRAVRRRWAGCVRPWTTFINKNGVGNKLKQKYSNKNNMYANNSDYSSNQKMTVNEHKKKVKKGNNQFLITAHPSFQDQGSFQSRWRSDLKFNWKSGLRKSPNSQDEFESLSSKNLADLNSSGWKISKHKNGNKSPDYFNNKSKPFVKNNLPPVILKTAQCFYK